MRTIIITVTLLTIAALPAGAAGGQGLPSPFEYDWTVEVPLTLTAGVLGFAPVLAGEIGGPACGAACDPATVNRFDRGVIGNRSEAADTASTWIPYGGFVVLLATKTADTLMQNPPDGFTGFAVDLAVFMEVQAVNLALNNAVRYTVRRPRPYAYDRGTPVEKRTATEASLSFYSLHASQMFAGAAVTSYTYQLRHPGDWMVVPTWIVSFGLGGAVAWLRVYSGNHFWSDVAAGAAAGTAIGLVIPWAHLKAGRRGETDGVSITPYFSGDTVGAVVIW